jgi:hypothetical protein
MKVGDRVRVTGIPPRLPRDDLRTEEIFSRCVGRVFPITGIRGGLLELEVGEVAGEVAVMHSIWIEREFVEAVDKA